MKRFEFIDKTKAGRKTSGYGYVIDKNPKGFGNGIEMTCTVFDLKFGKEIEEALNLKNELSKLRSGATKKEIEVIFKKYFKK